MAKTFADFEDPFKKATLLNEDGTTGPYGTVIGAWNYWYNGVLCKNNGALVCNSHNAPVPAGHNITH